jgi:copper chaperone CopZ
MRKVAPSEEVATVLLRLDTGANAARIRSLRRAAGVSSVEVDYIHDRVEVKFNPSKMTLHELRKILGVPDES